MLGKCFPKHHLNDGLALHSPLLRPEHAFEGRTVTGVDVGVHGRRRSARAQDADPAKNTINGTRSALFDSVCGSGVPGNDQIEADHGEGGRYAGERRGSRRDKEHDDA